MIEYIVYVLHPFYTLIHMAAGAVIFPILLGAKLTTLKEKLKLFVIGAAIAVVPDIPKIFLLHFGHSIFFTPFISLILAYFLKKFLQTSFVRLWIAVALTIILAHLLLDFLGNGVEILHPIVPDEYAFHIIGDEKTITIFLSLGLLIGLLIKYSKTVLFSFLMVLCLFFSIVGYSKIQLEETLSQHFSDDPTFKIETYPIQTIPFIWAYKIRTDGSYYYGTASIWTKEIHFEKRSRGYDYDG